MKSSGGNVGWCKQEKPPNYSHHSACSYEAQHARSGEVTCLSRCTLTKTWNVFPPSVSLSSQRTPEVWVVTAGCRPCCWHQWRKRWRGCPADISAGCHVPPAVHPPTRRADPPGGSGQTSLELPVDCRGLTAAPDCGWVGPEPGWSPQSGAPRLRRCCIAGKLVLTCNAQIHPGRGWEIERLTFRWRPQHSTTEKQQHSRRKSGLRLTDCLHEAESCRHRWHYTLWKRLDILLIKPHILSLIKVV